jgi:hypothetical protein
MSDAAFGMKISGLTILRAAAMGRKRHSEDSAADCESARIELNEFLSGLSHRELLELMAVMSVGRGDPGSDNFQALVDNIHLTAPRIVEYLLDKPHLAGDLEKGMKKLGLQSPTF